MSTQSDTNGRDPGKVRKKAVEQLSESAQLYYDTALEIPVVLRQKDGWGSIGRRDYFDRTWYVERVRCYLSDSGCELETIRQETKVNRIKSGRYANLTDEQADRVFDEAKAENLRWWKANSPHIPYAGEGGVNVYVDGEWMRRKLQTEEHVVRVGDDWPDPETEVLVVYDEDGIEAVEVKIGAEYVECERVDTGDAKAAFEPEGHDVRIELRLDDEFTDPHEFEHTVKNPGETEGATR